MNTPLVNIGRSSSARGVPRERWAHLRPTSAQIYLENRCHLSCRHCYESELSHPTKSDSLALEDYRELFDQLAQLGVLSLTFTGGEIFLRRDLLDIIDAARTRRFAVTLYTSGTLIDEVKADRLRALQVSDVHVSVYSHDPGVHDEFTQVPGSHGKSVRALKLLAERGVRTVLKSNVMAFNVDAIDDLMALARSLGAEIQLDPNVRPRMDGDQSPLRFAVPPEVIHRKLLVRPEIAPAFRKHRAEDYCSGERSILDEADVMCGAALSSLSVGADGSIAACGFFPVAGGRWRRGASLADIWLGSSHFDEVRRATFGTQSHCPSCDLRSGCNPCMAYALVETGDLRGCNSASRAGASAFRLLAEGKARANRKMSRGRALPIVGDVTMTPAASSQRRPLLHTEP